MASLYLNGKYWYIKSDGKGHGTGYTTDRFESKKRVKAFINALPEDNEFRQLLSDIRPEGKLSEKVKVEYAIEQYGLTIDGLGDDGKVVDENQNRNFKRVTKSAYGRILKEFKGKYLDEISDSDILKWIKKLRGEGLKPQSVKRYKDTFSPVFTHGQSGYRKWCKSNPILDEGAVTKEFRTNKGVWDYKGRKVSISPEQVEDFLSFAELTSKPFFILMLLNSVVGPRRRELLTIKREVIDLALSRVTVLTINAKKKEPRTVFFGFDSKLKMALIEFCGDMKAEDFIFSPDGGKKPYGETWVRDNFSKVRNLAGLPEKWTFRDFRHVAGQRMNKKGLPPSVIAETLGTSVKLLEKTYLTETQESMEQIMMERLG